MAEDTIYNNPVYQSAEDPEGTLPKAFSHASNPTVSSDSEGTIPEPQTDVVEDENESPKTGPLRSGWKSVTIGGVSGIMLGAARYAPHAFGAHSHSSNGGDTSNEEAQTHSQSNYSNDSGSDNDATGHSETLEEAAVQDNYDDMSFGQAFASARASLGPGEVFEWRGGLYTTDTLEEWEAAHPSSSIEIDVEEDDDSSAEIIGSSVGDSSQSMDGIMIDVEPEDMYEQEGNIVPDVEEDPEEGVILTDVEVINTDDGSMVMGSLSIDGEDAVIVDVDGDGTFDVIAADMNGDGFITENEAEDIQEMELGLDDFSQDDLGSDIDPSANLDF